jgi:hypothetical protein
MQTVPLNQMADTTQDHLAGADAKAGVAFTPGPWTQADRVVVAIPETHGYATWLANCSVGGCSAAEQLANARLIAAAPELYEAGEYALKCIESSDEHRAGNPAFEQAATMLRAALRKATGVSQ